MTRIFYDSVTASRIPRGVQGVMGYDDGLYKWSDKDWGLFPSSVHVHIAVFASTNSGTVLDVERYDASPEEAPGWVKMRRAAGVDPTVYMNTSTWPQVRAAFRNQGVPEPHYWVAQYDNVKIVPDGAIGKQYYNNDALGFDMSVVADYWPGVDPAPQNYVKEKHMLIVRSINGTDEVWAQTEGKYWHVASPDDLTALINGCKTAGAVVVELQVSQQEHTNLLEA